MPPVLAAAALCVLPAPGPSDPEVEPLRDGRRLLGAGLLVSRRDLWPVGLAAVALVGCLTTALVSASLASAALHRSLEERLRGAGESAALLVGERPPSDEVLAVLMRTNALDGAWLVDADLRRRADGSGEGHGLVDLLRVEADRVTSAFGGTADVAEGWDLGRATMATGYFPVRGDDGRVTGVLVLEAGQSFAGEVSRRIARVRWAGLALAIVAFVALVLVGRRWAAAMRRQQAQAERAAQAEVVSRMAASVAHDIRNPLGVIRGTVELTRKRSGATLSLRDDEALGDILGEVERLRQLTDDFLDLSADRPLDRRLVSVAPLLDEAARATRLLHSGVRIEVTDGVGDGVKVDGDAARLARVFRNLLANAAEARPEGSIHVATRVDGGDMVVSVRDQGPGVPAELHGSLFEPFATMGKTGGTGLGLAVSQRLVARHGGRLTHVPTDAGALFEVRLPVASSNREEA
jgi:two-component system OmpR family sensor kinase